MPNKLLTIAKMSPGTATAVASANLSPAEVSKMATFAALTNLHKTLTSIPQNEAYKTFQGLSKETQDMLSTSFHPKYQKEDKGFFGNVFNAMKSSAYYGGQGTWSILKQVANVAQNPIGTVAKVGFSGGKAALESSPLPDWTTQALQGLVGPQNKLVKQPYAAGRLATIAGEGGLGRYGSFIKTGAAEVLPGGQDASSTDGATNFKKYWEQASDTENVFDSNEVAKIDSQVKPEVAIVGKLLAGKKNLVDYFDTYRDNPEVLSLINKYSAGDKATNAIIADAVTRYSRAKVSVGRDVANTLTNLFPYDMEEYIKGDRSPFNIFSLVSGTIDAAVTFAADPLIIAGKARRVVLAAKLGLFKVGATAESLTKAFELPKVKEYWNNVGDLLNTYNTGNVQKTGQAAGRLADRFRELSPDVIHQMAKAGVKDADTALDYFKGQSFIEAMSTGNAGKFDTLIPTYSWERRVKDGLRDAAAKVILTGKAKTIEFPDTVEEVAKMYSEGTGWARNIGLKKVTVAGKETPLYSYKDQRAITRLDRVIRQFEIAPLTERTVSIVDGSSSNQVYRIMRTMVDKSSANDFRSAWIKADPGVRLSLYKGLLKTVGEAMGLKFTEEGRKILASIDEMSEELYSTTQSTINLGDIAGTLKLAQKGGIETPQGIRALAQQKLDPRTGLDVANQLKGSIGADMAAVLSDMEELKRAKRVILRKIDEGDLTNYSKDLDNIKDQLAILGGRLGGLKKSQSAVKSKIAEGEILELETFNAAEIDGTQRAIRMYQISEKRTMPDFNVWRLAATRVGIGGSLFGKATSNVAAREITDLWSLGNLFPRIIIRSAIEEVGLHGLIDGPGFLGKYIKGREMSRALRSALPAYEVAKLKQGEEKTTQHLGYFYNQLLKITKKHYSQDELLAAADNPELLGRMVATAHVKNSFKPEFLRTTKGKRVGGYAEDFAVNNDRRILGDINESGYSAENTISQKLKTENSLKQFGPSVYLNINTVEKMKGLEFSKEYSMIGRRDPSFLLHWLLDLNNTLGSRNGKFGNIVLWNLNKGEKNVVAKLTEYLSSPEGQIVAKKFERYNLQGTDQMAKNIFADVTNALRDSAGRINMDLVNSIRAKGGMEKFSIDDLALIDTAKYARPQTVLGRVLMPEGAGTPEGMIDRIKTVGYGFIGKQIALLDREPVLFGHYVEFRENLLPYQMNHVKTMVASGIPLEEAEKLAKMSANNIALNLARNRTLAYVDNANIRTNLAYNLRTFGRYYRATEDFWRRASRVIQHNPRALVRLAIINQSFEHSGFIHTDDKGQKYFTYPGDDILSQALGTVLSKIGVGTSDPLPIRFGGYVKMLTPSLDPVSAAPRVGGPLSAILFGALEKLPLVGDFVTSAEPIVTGAYPNTPFWRKLLPLPTQRIVDIAIGGEADTEQRTSAAVKAMRLLVSTGNGPTDPSQIDRFLHDTSVQAVNIQVMRFLFGLDSAASIRVFENKDVPQELLDSGVFTWASEYVRFLDKHKGEPNASERALVDFARLYPSKLVFTVPSTKADVRARFPKSFAAVDFVKKNSELMIDHKEGASFFIPVDGVADISSYSYLKANGYIENKDLEDFANEIATVSARKLYYERGDYYDNLIKSSSYVKERQYYRELLSQEQNILKAANPLLAGALLGGQGTQNKRLNALNDLRTVLLEGKAPNKKLGTLYLAMVNTYDDAQVALKQYESNSPINSYYKKAIKSDLRNTLVRIASDNSNAKMLYDAIFDPLIGE